MIHAYNKNYVLDGQRRLAFVTDYLATSCNLSCLEIEKIFKKSQVLAIFCSGNPIYISGKSGIELAKLVADEFHLQEIKKYQFADTKNHYYWAGYYLSYFVWYTCKSLNYIFNIISLESILKMYPCYHEMDIMHFVNDLDAAISNGIKETNLKLIRMINNLSQSDLAKRSKVSLRSIQLYEQRVNDINKAQVGSLLKIAKVLNRNIEDLLEYN